MNGIYTFTAHQLVSLRIIFKLITENKANEEEWKNGRRTRKISDGSQKCSHCEHPLPLQSIRSILSDVGNNFMFRKWI